jgi:hypothetical protein
MAPIHGPSHPRTIGNMKRRTARHRQRPVRRIPPPDAVAGEHAVATPRHYLRSPAAAAFLGAATQTLERWRVEGCGPPFIKLSNKLVVYDPRDLVALAEARKVSSTSSTSARGDAA